MKPGIWPPSPGFAPCAILISISSALARYAAETPKRPEATCLIVLRPESTVRAKRRGCSPPSPELLSAPRRAAPIAIVSCVSGESAPIDIAEAAK